MRELTAQQGLQAVRARQAHREVMAHQRESCMPALQATPYPLRELLA